MKKKRKTVSYGREEDEKRAAPFGVEGIVAGDSGCFAGNVPFIPLLSSPHELIDFGRGPGPGEPVKGYEALGFLGVGRRYHILKWNA